MHAGKVMKGFENLTSYIADVALIMKTIAMDLESFSYQSERHLQKQTPEHRPRSDAYPSRLLHPRAVQPIKTFSTMSMQPQTYLVPRPLHIKQHITHIYPFQTKIPSSRNLLRPYTLHLDFS